MPQAWVQMDEVIFDISLSRSSRMTSLSQASFLTDDLLCNYESK